MGLDSLVDDKTPEKNNETGLISNEGVSKKPVVGDDYPREDIEYDVEYKRCPTCYSKSKARNHRTWKCGNDNCSTIIFTMGYEEWYGKDFLEDV